MTSLTAAEDFNRRHQSFTRLLGSWRIISRHGGSGTNVFNFHQRHSLLFQNFSLSSTALWLRPMKLNYCLPGVFPLSLPPPWRRLRRRRLLLHLFLQRSGRQNLSPGCYWPRLFQRFWISVVLSLTTLATSAAWAPVTSSVWGRFFWSSRLPLTWSRFLQIFDRFFHLFSLPQITSTIF